MGGEAELRSFPPHPSTTLYTRVLALGGGKGGAKLPSLPAESKVFVYKLVGKVEGSGASLLPSTFPEPIYLQEYFSSGGAKLGPPNLKSSCKLYRCGKALNIFTFKSSNQVKHVSCRVGGRSTARALPPAPN